MKLVPTADINEKSRKLANLCRLDIPDVFQIGKVELLYCGKGLEEHIHPDMFEICYHFEGSQYYEIEGQGYETGSGDMFLTLPNEKHGTGNRREEKSRLYYLIFHCMPDTQCFMGLDEGLSRYIRDSLFSVKRRLFLGNNQMKGLLEQILQMYFSTSPFREARVRSLLTEFFFQVTLQIEQNKQQKHLLPEDIQTAVNYIEEHPQDTPSIKDLAGKSHLSCPQFKRKFKSYTGFSPYSYMTRFKIQLAQEMLQYTFMTATQIAYELGFSSSQHFATVFKKFIGDTPTSFRQKLHSSGDG